jgi:hypothetical protein
MLVSVSKRSGSAGPMAIARRKADGVYFAKRMPLMTLSRRSRAAGCAAACEKKQRIAGSREMPAIGLSDTRKPGGVNLNSARCAIKGPRRQPSSGYRDQWRHAPSHVPSRTACSRQRATPHRRCCSS